MKKALTLLIITLFLLSTAGNVLCEEMAKEGTSSSHTGHIGTWDLIELKEGTGVVVWEQKGIVLDDSGDKGPFHNAAQYCVGVTLMEKGINTTKGYCFLTLPDGDKLLLDVTQENWRPGPGIKKGTLKYIDGTGKFSGIQGGGEYSRYSVRPAVDGTYQGVSFEKFNWKLP
jgi:hypothetical protein